MTSIADIRNNCTKLQPNSVLRGLVVARKGPTPYGDGKMMLTVGLADHSGAMRCIIYDPAQFNRFTVDQGVVLRNFIRRDESNVVITRNSRSFMTGSITTTEAYRIAAKNLVDPEAAPVIPLIQAQASPPRTMVSVEGLIVQEDQEREVMVKNTPTKVKDIYIKDGTVMKCKVTLWRDACQMKHHPGDYIRITDTVTNNYKGEMSLSLTSRSLIEAAEPPLTEKEIVVEGLGQLENSVELITDSNEVFEVERSMPSKAVDDDHLEDWVVQHAPFSVKLTTRGLTVESIKLCQDVMNKQEEMS